MATITQTQKTTSTLEGPQFELDVAGWLRNNIFSNIWKTLFAIILVVANILIIRSAYQAQPVQLSYYLAPEGQPSALGNLILFLTNGSLLATLLVGLWFIGVVLVVYSTARRHWPEPVQWLKEKLYTGFFGALTSLALLFFIVFAVRGILAWTIFGASFETNPDIVATLENMIPGAVWGIVGVNLKVFAVGQYPTEAIWRVWAALGLWLVLAVLSIFAWNLGSPLKALRRPLVWAWLASLVIIYVLLRGFSDASGSFFEQVETRRWGGFLLTVVISVIGIVVSFPIGLLLALGRRSQVRGVPYLWLWGAVGILIYWILGNYPAEPVKLVFPIIFRDPPVWTIELSPNAFAILQAVLIVGLCWAAGHFFQGNLIKTFSVVYIEVIRGVPLITVLFMAQVMLPIFLPKGVEVDNLLRVIVGVILFSAAYLAENVRGGLQAIPRGQYEAAAAIGLSTAQSMRLIILPQALRAVIPALVGQFISLFKDTSLVAIVGLFDLLGIAKAVVAQPEWFGLQRETYAFVALVYWVCAFSMSSASRRLERKLGVGKY
jgi:general L-amino acid transport system permease protein